MWQLLAAAGLNYLQGKQAAKARNQQEVQSQIIAAQDEQAQWDQNLADNRAIQEANLLNTIRTGYRSGILAIQRAQGRQAAADAGLSIGQTAASLTGAVTANAAAAGTIGPSVDAVVDDIRMKSNDARARNMQDFLQGEENFDTQLHDILTQGEDVLRSSVKTRVRQAQDAKYISDSEVLASTLINTAGSYISSQMSLGLGKTKGA